jgi:hypothetical protein
MSAEVIIEEAFTDVFCHLMYDGGWMEIEQEEVDRECNWAMVSAVIFKMRDHGLTCFTSTDRVESLPLTRSTVSGRADPRTSSSVFLFEEFVPLEYRQQLSRSVSPPPCALVFTLTDTWTDLSGQREGRKEGMFV